MALLNLLLALLNLLNLLLVVSTIQELLNNEKLRGHLKFGGNSEENSLPVENLKQE